jgi:flavin reductase (DIM6/NTAB) family NADH-FMN oxidoreductase RutF
MCMKKQQLGPCITFFPQPTTLVSTLGEDGRCNLMTASWAGIVSKTPPTFALSLHQGRATYAHIRRSGEFVVNMVPASLAVEADFCGLTSGRELDKAALAGLALEPAEQVAPPLLAASPLCLECRYLREVELGEYRLVLGEILQVHAAAAAIGPEGSLSAAAFDPLVYLGGIREYWSLGAKVATAYRDGRQLFPPGE